MKTRFIYLSLFMLMAMPTLATANQEKPADVKPVDVQEVTSQPSEAETPITMTYEIQGDLSPTHELGCIELDDVEDEYTPIDLYAAYMKCIEVGEYQKARDLFLTAGAFGTFDKMRVTDTTAHQILTIIVARNSILLTPEQKEKLEEVITPMTAPKSKALQDLCEEVEDIGPPDYQPDYMIQQSLQVIQKAVQQAAMQDAGEQKLDAKSVLVEGFDEDDAWEKALKNYLKCELKSLF